MMVLVNKWLEIGPLDGRSSFHDLMGTPFIFKGLQALIFTKHIEIIILLINIEGNAEWVPPCTAVPFHSVHQFVIISRLQGGRYRFALFRHSSIALEIKGLGFMILISVEALPVK